MEVAVMDKVQVKKEKVIREFREELALKGYDKMKVYDEPFFKILNRVYKHKPENIVCHINRLNTLVFVIRFEHKYIYLEWFENKSFEVLLSITLLDDDFNKGGIYTTSIDEALDKIDDVMYGN